VRNNKNNHPRLVAVADQSELETVIERFWTEVMNGLSHESIDELTTDDFTSAGPRPWMINKRGLHNTITTRKFIGEKIARAVRKLRHPHRNHMPYQLEKVIVSGDWGAALVRYGAPDYLNWRRFYKKRGFPTDPARFVKSGMSLTRDNFTLAIYQFNDGKIARQWIAGSGESEMVIRMLKEFPPKPDQ
jgi:hypothetical protein